MRRLFENKTKNYYKNETSENEILNKNGNSEGKNVSNSRPMSSVN